MLASDTIGLVTCVWCAAWLLFPREMIRTEFASLIAPTLAVTVLLARHQGFYHSIVRYVGMDLAGAGLKVTIASAATLAAVTLLSGLTVEPFRFAIVYSALFIIYLLGSRYTARYFLNRRNPGRERVIVYGAGEAGARLVLAM